MDRGSRKEIDISTHETHRSTHQTHRPARRPGIVLGALVMLLSSAVALGQTFSFEGVQRPTSLWDEVAPEVTVLIGDLPPGSTVHAVFLQGASVLSEGEVGPHGEATDVRLSFAALQVVTIRCDRAPLVGLVATSSASSAAGGDITALRAQSSGSCLDVEALGPFGLQPLPITWAVQGQHVLVADRWLPVMVLVARRADGSAELPRDLVAAYVAVTTDGERPELPQPVSPDELSQLRNAALGW